MVSLRILSLLPAATEIVYLLSLEKYLVGVSHECDWPPEVKSKPKVTSSEISNVMSSREIDEKVKKMGHKGPGVFHIKEGVLKKLRPNLILTQELCEVCALTPSVILNEAKDLKFKSRDSSRIAQNDNLTVISLEPESVEDILENILLIGEFSGKSLVSRRTVKKLRNRLKILDSRLLILATKRPKVCVVEWLDPIMVAGHWVPEMVEKAGGVNLITKRGQRSKTIKLNQIAASKPDILIISPCGFDIQRTIQEKALIKKIIREVGEVRMYLVNGNSYMTRPGPRIIDGIEILAEILHPEIFKRKHFVKDWVNYNLSFRA